jgi:hypothetical protein
MHFVGLKSSCNRSRLSDFPFDSVPRANYMCPVPLLIKLHGITMGHSKTNVRSKPGIDRSGCFSPGRMLSAGFADV